MKIPSRNQSHLASEPKPAIGYTWLTFIILSVMICLIIGTAIAELNPTQIIAIGTATAAIITAILRVIWKRT